MTIDLRKSQHISREQYAQPTAVVRDHGDTVRHSARTRTSPLRQRERVVMMFAGLVIGIIVLVILGFGISSAWGRFFGGSDYEMRSLISHVGDHMLLPVGETPTLATVSDLHALEGQAFFKNAREGDKVLMYLVSKRAILYRPSIDRIIEVGPITGAAK